MTSLWKMTQISKLKAGSFVEAGTGIPLNSESPSHGLTFHPPPGTVAVGAASGSSASASGHWHGACARRTLRLAVRDCQGLWAEEQRTARVAFGYSPLFGCLLLTSPPVLLEKDSVAR
jgi:hypothetical protein